MKGFIKILESIIAAIILLTALTFFFTPAVRENVWENTILQQRGEDAVATWYRTGLLDDHVKSNNASAANDLLLKLLPKTVDYSLIVSGIPNSIIFVGCNCTNSELENLESRLEPLDFTYHGRDVEIRIETDSVDSIRDETDVLLFIGYENLSSKKQKLEDFIESGGTVMMISNLNENQVRDGVMDDLFGLSWGGPSNPSSNGVFTNLGAPSPSFRVNKYLENTSDFDETTKFDFDSGGGINRVNRTQRTIIEDQSSVYSFVEPAEKSGRTLWFAGHTENPATDALLKAAIMWASGERYEMDTHPKFPAPNHIEVRFSMFDDDPYEVVLKLWNVFQ